MPIITVLLMLISVGLLLWTVNKKVRVSHVYNPRFLNWFVGTSVTLWLLTLFGALGNTASVHCGRIIVLGLR